MWKVQIYMVVALVSATSAVRWSSSVEIYRAMSRYEVKLLNRLRNQTLQAELALKTFREEIDRVQRSAMKIMEEFELNFEHPIRHLRMLKRYADEWKEMKEISELHFSISQSIQGNITRALEIFPKYFDQDAARSALLRLQDAYRLKTQDMADGRIKNSVADESLSAGECAAIAMVAARDGRKDQCVEWIRESLARCYSKPIGDGKVQLPNYMPNCSAIENDENIKKHTELYHKLCANEILQPKLKCYFWTANGNPWFAIGPIKMEMLRNNPRIVRFYDVVHDAEIQSALAVSKTLLEWGNTLDNDENSTRPKILAPRIGHVAWLFDNETYETENSEKDNAVLRPLSNKLKAIVGLKETKARETQVGHYGLGGRFLFHEDNFAKGSKEEEQEGNRIASLLFYLSDVQYGGNTVFKYPKIAAKPIKGSAILWYNIKPNGDGDFRLRHAGCPILLGTKWFAVKWFHEIENGMSRNPKYFDEWDGN